MILPLPDIRGSEPRPERTTDPLLAYIKKHAKGQGKFVITSAQNATPIFEPGFKALLNYCNKNDALLLVIPFRYKNPTARWSKAAKKDDWWVAELQPYLFNQRVDLNEHLTLLADIMTQPTADRPLSGFETISGPRSAIIGHPKLELLTVATPQQKLPKLLTTTGAITEPNYLPTKTGKKGEFHHTYGATVVEVCGDRFHIRQINMVKDGSFFDMTDEYSATGVKHWSSVPGLVMGDTHVAVIDWQANLGTRKLIAHLKPKELVWHDVFDGTSCNHHDRGRVFHDIVKQRNGQNDVSEEVWRAAQHMNGVGEMFPKMVNVVVPSNHNEFLREWIENTDPREDAKNGRFWAETYLAVTNHEGTRWTPSGVAVADPFQYWADKWMTVERKVLRRDEPYQIAGIEVGYHGDKGPNGVRGSRRNFSKIGVKSIIGHSHSPGITDGCYQVGTSSMLNLSYASGSPSSWLQTHCVIYPNGKRSLINIIDGRWHA